MITVGIDCGAKNTKTVVMKDKEIIGKASTLTGFDQAAAIKTSFEAALKDAGIEASAVEKIGGTGAGIEDITQADIKVNEIKAIAKAANYYCPSARTVTDVGAEEGRAVKIGDKGQVEG